MALHLEADKPLISAEDLAYPGVRPTALEATQPSARGQGQKKDAGKLPLELIPTRPIEEVAKVLAFGAKKYRANGWRAGIAYSRVYAAVMRHVWAWWRGEDNDQETGLPHLAHAACEIFFLLEYSLRPNGSGELDDRAGNDMCMANGSDSRL